MNPTSFRFALSLCPLLVASLTCATGQPVQAQDSEAPPSSSSLGQGAAAAGGAISAGTAAEGGAAPSAAQMGALLGGGEFYLIVDRPYEAEKLYKAVLAQDPTNEAALAGMRRVEAAKKPSVTALLHSYRTNFGVRMLTYGAGPTFRTPYGRVTLLAGTGRYRQDGQNVYPSLVKSTTNLILEPYHGKYEGYVFLSRATYNRAPDRTLYNLKLSYVPQPGRERYTATIARNDSFLQSDQGQFYGPESIFSIQQKLIEDQKGVALEHPLGQKVDFLSSYDHLDYSDGNRRDIVKAQVLYRLLPSKGEQMPIARVGLGYLSDDAKRPAQTYFAPVNFQSVSLVANYVKLSRKLRYGAFGTYGLTGKSGTGMGRFGASRTAYVFANYNVSNSSELYVKFTAARASFGTPEITDAVVGVNFRF